MTDIVPATLQRVSAVATLPAIAMRIMRIADDPMATSDAMHEVLSSDPALAARVLKVVNSAFYGRPRQVSSTYAAIQLLGVSAIRNIAVAASLTRIFRGGRSVAGFDAPSLWVHSVGVGAAARRLAEVTTSIPPEEALLAGLLHDIGIMVSMQAWLPEFTAVVAATTADPFSDFRDVERQIVGADHEQFGAALCAEWQFPTPLVLACGHHHDPMALPESERALPLLVQLADVLATRADIGFTRTVLGRVVSPQLLEAVGIRAVDLEPIERGLTEDLTQAMLLFAA